MEVTKVEEIPTYFKTSEAYKLIAEHLQAMTSGEILKVNSASEEENRLLYSIYCNKIFQSKKGFSMSKRGDKYFITKR